MMKLVRYASVAIIGCCITLCCGCQSSSPEIAYVPETPVATPPAKISPVAAEDRESVVVEEIVTKEVLKRKVMYWKGFRLMSEGLKAMNAKNYPEAIEKLTNAEKIFRQLAPGHAASRERLQLLRKNLGSCHRDYALILLKKGRAKNDAVRFDQAKTHIMAAIRCDESLKPAAQDFIRDLKEQRYWAQFD